MSILESEDVNLPLLYSLKEAQDRRWTGIFKVFKDSDQIGVVVMHEGRMAWASSTNQIESFGSILEKIGNIPKERQKEIVDQVKAFGKTKELGALLEEAGLISSHTLRECIRRQIQVAFESFAEIENIEIVSKECDININPDLVFRIEQVLPDSVSGQSSVDGQVFDDRPVSDNSGIANGTDDLENVLKSLSSLIGYQCSFIYDLNAKMLASHKSDTISGELDNIINSSISWVLSSNAALNESEMGKMEFVLLDHDKGSLVAQWHNPDRNFFVAASFDKNGKTGVIRHKISEMIPAIVRITAESH